ncbi:MAG: tetratricopeptide repeat protein [Rhodospirillaceae bacterium]
MQLSSMLKTLLSLVSILLFQGCTLSHKIPNSNTAHLAGLDTEPLIQELKQISFEARLKLSDEAAQSSTPELFFAALIAKEDLAPSVTSQILLAHHYRSGVDFISYEKKADLHRALYWYEKAAAAGNVEAQFNVACLTYKIRQARMFSGLPEPQRSYKVALYMQKAAEKGLVLAQLDMASLYRYGVGVERNLVTAELWLGRARQSLAESYTQSIDIQPAHNQRSSKSGIYPGTSEPWYLLPRDSKDWFNTGVDALKAIDITTAEGQNAYIARYLRSGYCSPAYEI